MTAPRSARGMTQGRIGGAGGGGGLRASSAQGSDNERVVHDGGRRRVFLGWGEGDAYDTAEK